MKLTTYDLREITNNKCIKNCSPEKRKEITNNDICKIAKSEIDGLPIRCVGKWAYEKIFRLNQYFGIFANAMKNKWSGLNYIEICSGTGRCVLRETGEEIDGTSLSILQHPSYSWIKKSLFIDIQESVVEVLNTRILNLGIKNAEAIVGDYNQIESLNKILDKLDQDNLNLVFIDPTDCSVPFSTIEAIVKKLKHVDFIMNFAYGTDLIRNLRKAINNTEYACREKYSKFLGEYDYFEKPEVLQLAKNSINEKKIFHHFFDAYKQKLKSIDLKYIDSKLVKNYYMLVFASGSEKGLKFWERSQRISPDDQREIDFSL